MGLPPQLSSARIRPSPSNSISSAAAALGDELSGERLDRATELVDTGRVLRQERMIMATLGEDGPEYARENRNILTGNRLDVELRSSCDVGSARVDHHELPGAALKVFQ